MFVPYYVCIAFSFLIIGLFASMVYKCRQKSKAYKHIDMLGEVFEAPGHGLVLFDPEGDFVIANKQAYQFLEYLNEEESKKQKLSAFLDYLYDHAVECDESLKNTVLKISEKAPGVGFKEVISWGVGNLCVVEALKTASGGTVLVMLDISSMHEQEERVMDLYDTNFGLGQAVEAAPAGVVVTNPLRLANPIVFCNSMFSSFLNADVHDLINVPVEAVFQAMGDEESVRDLYKVFEQAQPIDIEICRTENGGEKRYFSFFLKPVLGCDDSPEIFVGILSDITDLKKREASMYQSQKLEALGQLAAGVAHDFNNILSIIDGYARLAGSDEGISEETRDYTKKIRSASGRGAALTKKMLTFSRHKVQVEVVEDLAQTVVDQEELLRPLLDATMNLMMNVNQQDRLHVECASDNIVQILMNLVVNARDAMQGGGNIVVETYRCNRVKLPPRAKEKILGEEMPDKDYACLSVSDQGCGMSKEIISRIFDPFYSTKEAGKGTGLGLSMVYGLVQQMQGHIEVHSVEGRGTTFSIYFPLTDKEVSRKVEGSLDDIEHLSLKGYRVLIAEDEDDLRELVCGMLEGLDMEVIKASDGNEALALQDDIEDRIDLLLTDVSMPGMDGIKLAGLIRSLRPETEIVFMSGYPDHKKRAYEEWPEETCFMAKPIKMETLAKIVYEKLVAKKQGRKVSSKAGAAGVWKENKPQDSEG